MLSRTFAIAAVLAVTATVALTSADAQSNDEVTLFGQGNFRGSSVTLTGPRERMDPIQVESLRLSPGSAWELCSGRTFTGCKRFSESHKSMIMTVRSARPVAPAIPAGATVPQGEALSGSGASLRGFTSEFFVMPSDGGKRVEVGAVAGALPQSATEFCRRHGWRASPYQREQTVNGRNYLADVLCTDKDR